MKIYNWKEGRSKDIFMDKAKQKNQHHQIILALDLIILNFNDIFTMNFEIQFYGEWWFHECKIGPLARSWDAKRAREVALIVGESNWTPIELDYRCSLHGGKHCHVSIEVYNI